MEIPEICLKLRSFARLLRSVMKRAVPLHATWDVSHPFFQGIHYYKATRPLVT